MFNSTRSWRFWPKTKLLANEISSGFWVRLLVITTPNTAGGDGIGIFWFVSSTSVSLLSEHFEDCTVKKKYN